MNPQFILDLKGKSFVLYQGLLDEAHQQGLKSISTALVQIPSDLNGNVAICHATVELQDGRTFQGIGDASPANVSRAMAVALIRFAETRAKARALRDAVNVGMTSVEELSDDEAPAAAPRTNGHAAPPAQPKPPMAQREFSQTPEGQEQARLRKLRDRYQELAKEAMKMSLAVHVIPPEATEDQILDFGHDLKGRLEDARARQAKQAR